MRNAKHPFDHLSPTWHNVLNYIKASEGVFFTHLIDDSNGCLSFFRAPGRRRRQGWVGSACGSDRMARFFPIQTLTDSEVFHFNF